MATVKPTIIERKVKQKFKDEIESARQDNGKSKTKYLLQHKKEWTPGVCPQYMKRMTRSQASIVFKARSRMLECKGNYKNKYKGSITCRACQKEEETQQHILSECTAIHEKNDTKVTIEEIFTEETNELKQTVEKIQLILTKLEVLTPSTNNTRSHP